MSETKEGIHWRYAKEGSTKLMSKFLGPGQIEAWEKRTEKARKSEQLKRKPQNLDKELLEEVRAVSEGKDIREFRKEKEQRQRRESKITEKQKAKEEIKERKN